MNTPSHVKANEKAAGVLQRQVDYTFLMKNLFVSKDSLKKIKSLLV